MDQKGSRYQEDMLKMEPGGLDSDALFGQSELHFHIGVGLQCSLESHKIMWKPRWNSLSIMWKNTSIYALVLPL